MRFWGNWESDVKLWVRHPQKAHPCVEPRQNFDVFCNKVGVGVSAVGHWNTHTHAFNGPLSGTTQVSRYQKGKTNLDFTGARDSDWQWHQLGHMQVCTSLQTDNHASTPPQRVLKNWSAFDKVVG